MPEFPGSQLPKDPGYWEELSRRIRQDAAPVLAAYAAAKDSWRPKDSWYQVLSRSAFWWVGSSAAAILLLWLSLPVRTHPPDTAWIESAVLPTESAGALMSGPAPPGVDELVAEFFPFSSESGGRQ